MEKIQKISKKIIIAFAILILSMNIYVYADSQELGKINFESETPNLEVKVYQIGKMVDGKFSLNEAYQNVDINDYTEKNIASIEEIASNEDNPVFTKTTDEDGKISFEDVELGIYLIVQSNNKEALKMQTILVKLPEVSDDKMNLEVTVKPKIEKIEKVEKEKEQANEETKLDDKIPYTGTLNWPIPVLAGASLIVFSIGWIVYYSGKNKKKIN